MTTPAEAHARALALLQPATLYSAQQLADVVGMHPCNVNRAVERGKLAAHSRRPLRCSGESALAWTRSRAAHVQPGSGVIARARSNNMKLGRAAVTIVARQSCPDSCAFKEKGCYAEHDNTRIHWDRITAGALDATPLQLALAEADAIDQLPADRDLRLHVAGDSATSEGTRVIAAACWRYTERARATGLAVKVWGYTHAWRRVPRECWGRVSILASCETVADVAAARERGYAAALVVDRFGGDAAYPIGTAKVIPCPQQTRDRTCTACRLCFDDARLRGSELAIGFSLHGGGTNKARAALTRRALPVVA
ncbi:MAG TPA: hypothetical protein VGE74_05810 [Gemmata sp.]